MEKYIINPITREKILSTEFIVSDYFIIKEENQQLKEKLERSEKARKEAIEYINKTEYSDVVGLNNNGIKEFWFVRELVKILDNKGE